MSELKQLNVFLGKCKKIYIYGAGKVGKGLFLYLTNNTDVKIAGFIVSNKFENDTYCYEKQVFQLSEINIEEDVGVIVAIQQIPFQLRQRCFDKFGKNILFMYAQLQNELQEWQQKWLCNQYNVNQAIYALDADVKKKDPACIYLKNIKEARNIFRIYELEDISQFAQIREHCNLKEFQQEYGTMKLVEYGNHIITSDKKRNIEVYIVTSHLDNMNPDAQNREPYKKVIQVGTGLTGIRKRCLLDNEGDNISLKNQEYCECTGLYWIWKNTKGQDYVGLEHYRRRMKIDEFIIEDMYQNNIDILVPIPQFGILSNLEFMNRSLVTISDWKIIKEIIVSMDESYADVLTCYENGYFYFSCNIGLLKRVLFDEYCEFAFSVAEQLEQYYESNNIIRKGDRYMGFIFEHLFSIFIMRNYKQWNIYCTDLLWFE